MPHCQHCTANVEIPNRVCGHCREELSARAPAWPHRCDDCGRPVSTKSTIRCHPCNGFRHAKAAVTCPSCGGPKDRQSRRCMTCKRGSVLVEGIEKAENADERKGLKRRRENREAMKAVDLDDMRRDLIVADRPAMLVDLAELASRSRSSFVLRAWP